MDRRVVLRRSVAAVLVQSGLKGRTVAGQSLGREGGGAEVETHRVREVTGRHGFLDRDDVAGVGVGLDDDLDSLAEGRELVSDVSYSRQTLVLNVVLRSTSMAK